MKEKGKMLKDKVKQKKGLNKNKKKKFFCLSFLWFFLKKKGF